MVTPIGTRNHKSEIMSHRAEGEGQDRETTQEANTVLASTETDPDPEIGTLIPEETGLTAEKDLGRDQEIDMIGIGLRETEITGSTRVDLRDRVEGGDQNESQDKTIKSNYNILIYGI